MKKILVPPVPLGCYRHAVKGSDGIMSTLINKCMDRKKTALILRLMCRNGQNISGYTCYFEKRTVPSKLKAALNQLEYDILKRKGLCKRSFE